MSPFETLPAIDADQAVELLRGPFEGVLLDVREYQEWMAGHAVAARHIPMGDLPDRLDELPRDARIVCVCRSGNRSRQVTAWLLRQGYDAVNLSGGMQHWASFGHPMVNHAGNPGVVI